MIQISSANNSNFNMMDSSLELKQYMNQIATTQNLRDQLVNQIYIITNIQKAINDDSIQDSLDKFLSKYNDSISNINGAILTKDDKLAYFDIKKEKSSYEKQKFTMSLASKCKEVETVFDQIATLNEQAIKGAKECVESHKSESSSRPVDYSRNISINNAVLSNRI